MNETNFSKYLEQRNSELYEQMLDEGVFGDIVGGVTAGVKGLGSAVGAGLRNFTKAAYDTVATGVKSGVKAGAMKGVKGIGDAAYNTVKTGIDSASKSYANRDVDRAKELMDYASDPDLINALKSYVSMTTNQQAPAQQGRQAPAQQGRQAPNQQGQQAPAQKGQQQAPNVDNNFLKSFKILFKAVKGTEFTDEMLNIVNKNNHSFPTMWGNLEKKLFENFKDLWIKYYGREFTANGKWKTAKLFGGEKSKIQQYLKLKNLVKKGSKHFSHPNYKSKAITVPADNDEFDFSDFNTKGGGEFGFDNRGRPRKEHYNLTFKNWFDQRLTLEISDPNFRKLALYRNKQSLCVDKPKYFQNQIEIEKLKGANANQKNIQDMQYNIDQCKVRCDALNSNDGSKNIG